METWASMGSVCQPPLPPGPKCSLRRCRFDPSSMIVASMIVAPVAAGLKVVRHRCARALHLDPDRSLAHFRGQEGRRDTMPGRHLVDGAGGWDTVRAADCDVICPPWVLRRGLRQWRG